MFKRQDIITAIEIGTSKICVLVGSVREGEALMVIGRGEAPSDGAVVKGEIVDMDAALEALVTALEIADKSAGGEVNNSRVIAMSVTACDIASFQGVGTVFINAQDHRVGMEDIEEAVRTAQIKPLPPEQMQLNTFDAFYLLDGTRRVRSPFEQVAHKLEAFLHVIHGNANRIENFRSLLNDAGFAEVDAKLVFSGIADVYGILTDEEKENGVLLVDFGAGTTEYAVVYNFGVLASGVLPVGTDHLANDLSLGLNLNFNQCRKFLKDGMLERAVQSGQTELEMRTLDNTVRRIPVSSFEKIVDLRYREIFELIRQRLGAGAIARNLGCGGVITGGGANSERACSIFQSVFEFPFRIGRPYDASGALTDLEDPRYSTVWGTLRYGEDCNKIMANIRNRGVFGRLFEAAGSVGDQGLRKIGNLISSIRV